MATPAPPRKFSRPLPLILAAIVAVLLIVGLIYLNQPPKTVPQAPPTAEAKAYVSHLKLSGVSMRASENMVRQRLVEINGTLTNTGPRTLRSVDVYCIFRGINGGEVFRDRVAMISAGSPPLKPNQARSFRLPFDHLPDTWNQTLPGMVIAGITFAE